MGDFLNGLFGYFRSNNKVDCNDYLRLSAQKLAEVIQHVTENKLTYLTDEKLECISLTCQEIEEKKIPGLFVEAGCALGGSAILIAASKARERKLNIYDVFGMIPTPSVKDTPDVHARYELIRSGQSQGIGGDTYYGYIRDLRTVVERNLNNYGIDLLLDNVNLVEGLLQDTLHLGESVAFAHVDVDWYEPVMTALQRIVPRLSIGGSVIVDDYYDWGGCKKAVDEFLSECSLHFVIDDSARSRKLTRVA
jgi:hypothetical protein